MVENKEKYTHNNINKKQPAVQVTQNKISDTLSQNKYNYEVSLDNVDDKDRTDQEKEDMDTLLELIGLDDHLKTCAKEFLMDDSFGPKTTPSKLLQQFENLKMFSKDSEKIKQELGTFSLNNIRRPKSPRHIMFWLDLAKDQKKTGKQIMKLLGGYNYKYDTSFVVINDKSRTDQEKEDMDTLLELIGSDTLLKADTQEFLLGNGFQHKVSPSLLLKEFEYLKEYTKNSKYIRRNCQYLFPGLKPASPKEIMEKYNKQKE